MPTQKEIQLKKHKTFATGLFLLMVAIYVITVYLSHQPHGAWVGYVHAFSEAAMVGALADWFAVTALFRYPMGLKIPHTNLIENKKNDIGENLGAFVKDNFLTPENIRPYIEKLNIVDWVSKWLKETKNQGLLVAQISLFVKKILVDLDNAEVSGFISKKVTEALRHIDFATMMGKGVHYVIENKEHLKLLDNILPQVKSYAENSQAAIRERVNKQKPLIGFLAGKKISKEFTQGIVDFIEEVDQDKSHWLRKKITEELEKFEVKLETDPKWQETVTKWKDQFIVEEKIEPYVTDAWDSIKKNGIDSLSDEQSVLRKYLISNIEKLAADLQEDDSLRKRINGWVQKFAFTTAMRNRDQVEKVIGATVSQWKGRELSEKLELEIGKDLQYIRVNGTIVGGLVGLLIYILTNLIFS
ncbi:MAG: DUF445 domain-containing protein [Pseudopedobacter saltans]|uniref:DUF445 domain-containing protein n=1 Tax=Pseudopedobacter saltans TaxID=151895 RepID=A0A2W5H2T4_9SPHI|nr:MAG: DUF445 domain-containing protein [Pseudopedobacter saltans]